MPSVVSRMPTASLRPPAIVKRAEPIVTVLWARMSVSRTVPLHFAAVRGQPSRTVTLSRREARTRPDGSSIAGPVAVGVGVGVDVGVGVGVADGVGVGVGPTAAAGVHDSDPTSPSVVSGVASAGNVHRRQLAETVQMSFFATNAIRPSPMNRGEWNQTSAGWASTYSNGPFPPLP